MEILEEKVCELGCDCGWNIKIGGEDKKELEQLKKFIEDKQNGRNR